MPQWKSSSLFSLITFFIVFLLVFNISAYKLGKKTILRPFKLKEQTLRINISNADILNAPITIHPLPYVKETMNVSVWCGLEAIKTSEKLDLSRDYYIPLLSNCDHMLLEVWPCTNSTGLWLKSQRPIPNLVILSTKLLISLVFGITVFIFFKKGKSASIHHSTVAIIFSAFLIMDPFGSLLNLKFPNAANHLSNIFVCIGLRLMSSTIFTEYSPLVRKTYGLISYLPFIPALFLFISFFADRESELMGYIKLFGAFVGLILPLFSIWFLVMAGNTTGSFALAIHIISGVFVVTTVFYYRLIAMADDNFSLSLVAETIEVSLVASFSVFQLAFKTGEGVEEEALGHFPSTTTVKRYDKIDEILNSLVAEDETVKFDDIDLEEENPLQD